MDNYKLLKFKEFDQYLKKEKYDVIYEKFIILTWKIAREIAEALSMTSNVYNKSYTVQKLFKGMENDFGFYKYFCCLTKWNEDIEISNYYIDGESRVLYNYDEKVEYLIELYNNIINSLKEYCKTKIKYSNLKDTEILEKEKEKIINLFKKMLTEIEEKYDSDWNLEKWLEIMNFRYMYFSEYFGIIEKNLLKSKEKNIILIASEFDKAYDYLSKEYKNDVEFYKKYKLMEGQTYKELYDKKTTEFEKLLREMLEFIGVNTDCKDLSALEADVIEYYPYYASTIFHISASDSIASYTYKEKIEYLDTTCQNFSNNYKNHKENLKIYKERRK